MAGKAFYTNLCIFLLLIDFGNSLNTSYLKKLGGNCYEKSSCKSGRGSRLQLSLDWTEKNCFCDDDCIKYGDCCYEAKAYNRQAMKTANTNFECINVQPFGSFYMKGTCLEEWTKSGLNTLCQKAFPKFPIFNHDPFLDMPVTSLVSDITYKNYYCAVCNGENTKDIEVWHAQLSCPENVEADEIYLEKHLRYFNKSWGLYYNYSNEEKFFPCDVYPTIKDTIVDKVRRCKDYTSTCSQNWTDSFVADLCYSYTSLVYGPLPNNSLSTELPSLIVDSPINSIAYRNYYCAVCNFVDEDELTCYERNYRQIPPLSPVSFSVLFDFGKRHPDCKPKQIWDPFSQMCRSVICLNENFEFRDEKCVNVTAEIIANTSKIIEEYNNVTEKSYKENPKLKCDKLFINESDFTRGDNGTIVVTIFRRTYQCDEYEPYKEGILVCIPNSYSRLMGWLTFSGIGLSCLCIIIHLITFILMPDLRNLSGKNLASMCSALLVAYICFLITSLKESGTNSCPVLASIMYYFFLASFTWVNVMAFDIWRTLQRSTSELRVTSGKQWKKFIFYSLYAWLFPLFALTFVLIVDNSQPVWMDPSYLPDLGKRLCWFGQRKAILVYFAAPLAFIMLLNIFFFILAVKMVAITSRSTNSNTFHSHQTHLKLYLRLALLMGLSWISGIVAGYIQEEYMWYLFILLNAFQGLYILIGFTLTKKVFRAIKGINLIKTSCRIDSNKGSTSRQTLESQDSQFSHTSTSTLGTSSNPSNSKLPITALHFSQN